MNRGYNPASEQRLALHQRQSSHTQSSPRAVESPCATMPTVRSVIPVTNTVWVASMNHPAVAVYQVRITATQDLTVLSRTAKNINIDNQPNEVCGPAAYN